MKRPLIVAAILAAFLQSAAVAHANVATDWNRTMIGALETSHLPPPQSMRTEDGPAGPQVLDDVRVVDDLLPDVDRASVESKSPFDRLDRPFDPGAIASRGGEEETFHHCFVTIAGVR